MVSFSQTKTLLAKSSKPIVGGLMLFHELGISTVLARNISLPQSAKSILIDLTFGNALH